MAWGSQMHKTYYGDYYWVPTWTVCAVRCSRLCGQRQRKPIHTSRIQGVLRNLPNKAHNHTAISPKIKRPGWTFCRHVKASPQKSIRCPNGQFLQVYRITPNPSTPLAVSPAETMFARKIRSVFDKLLPKQNKLRKTTLAPKKGSTREKKFTLKDINWERGIIKKRIGDMVYIVEGPKYTHKETPEKVTGTPFERLQRRTTNTRRVNRHHFRHVRFRSSPIKTWNTSVREKKEIHWPVDDRPKKKKNIKSTFTK